MWPFRHGKGVLVNDFKKSGNLSGFDTQQETLLKIWENSQDGHKTEIETRVYFEDDTGEAVVEER